MQTLTASRHEPLPRINDAALPVLFGAWSLALVALDVAAGESIDRLVAVAAFVSVTLVFTRAHLRSAVAASPWWGLSIGAAAAVVAYCIWAALPQSRFTGSGPWMWITVALYGVICIGSAIALLRGLRPALSHAVLRPLARPFGYVTFVMLALVAMFASLAAEPQRALQTPLVLLCVALACISVTSAGVGVVVLWRLGRHADLVCLLATCLHLTLSTLWMSNPNRNEDQLSGWLCWMLLATAALLPSAPRLGEAFDHRPLVSTAAERDGTFAFVAIGVTALALLVGVPVPVQVGLAALAVLAIGRALLLIGRSDGAPLASIRRLDRLTRDLPGALVNDEVGLRFRAVRHLNDGSVVAVSADPVWKHKACGDVRGDELASVVARAGLRTQFDVGVMERALPNVPSVLSLLAGEPWISVPIAASTLSDPSFEADMKRAFAWWGGDVTGFVFALDDLPSPDGLAILQRLQDEGLWVSITADVLDRAIDAGLEPEFVVSDSHRLRHLVKKAPAGTRFVVTEPMLHLRGPALRPGQEALDPWAVPHGKVDPETKRQAALLTMIRRMGADLIADASPGAADPLSVILATVHDPTVSLAITQVPEPSEVQ